MTAVGVLFTLVAAVFSWIVGRARREWRDADELSRATATGITSLYLLFAAALALVVIERPWPLELPLGVATATGGALIAGGAAVVVAGARRFGSPAHLYGVERGGLVEGGIYRFSRNPQYVGLAASVAGVAVVGRSWPALALAGAFWAGLWLWVTMVEEPHLRKAFGPRYGSYQARVPRFVGRPLPRTDSLASDR